jgi:hypothetical protein
MKRLIAAVAIVMSLGSLVGAMAQVQPSRDVHLIADLPVWRRVTLGTLNNANAIRAALERAHVHIGDSANEILGRPSFALSQAKIESDLVVVAVSDLGFGDKGAPLADVYARAHQLGLELCPAEVAPYLRLQYLQQPVGEILQIAMAPVTTYGGDPVDLAVADGGEGLLLVGGEARSDRVATGAVQFVFVRPRRPIVSGGAELR